MRILITGANGFLGHYLTELLLQKGHEVIATGKGDCRLPFTTQKGFEYHTMDFTDLVSSRKIFSQTKPRVVVHAGAMSKPDDCEKEQRKAYQANVEGTMNMLSVADEYRCHFIFLSTDFIFDGLSGMYSENDRPGPVNFYGKTKAEAEGVVKEYEYDWTIVRTILVYGKPIHGGANILTVVKEKLEKGEGYNVFDDQLRTPTYVEDLAAGVVSVIEKRARGIYHLSGEDALSPYEMACKAAQHLGLDMTLLKKVVADEFPQPARRPAKTGFVITKAKTELDFRPIRFAEGLVKTFGKG